MEAEININKDNRHDIIYEYINLIKTKLGITKNAEIKALSCLFVSMYEYSKQAKNMDDLREKFSGNGNVKQLAVGNDLNYNVFCNSLSSLRSKGFIDNYNMPKKLKLFGPVCDLANGGKLIININLIEEKDG